MRSLFISLLALTLSYAPVDQLAAQEVGAGESYLLGASSGLLVPTSANSALLKGYNHGRGTYTNLKGVFGESLMDDYYAMRNWSRVEPVSVSRNVSTGELVAQRPGAQGRSGLDGIYIRWDKNGQPQRVMVTEAKTYGSRLARDVTGVKQFSPDYRNTRLSLTSQFYREAAENLRSGSFQRSAVRPVSDSQFELPIDSRRKISLWYDSSKQQWSMYSADDVSSIEASRQLRKMADLLKDAADGNVTYTSRVFRFQIDARNTVSLRTIDPDSGLQKQIGGQLDDLPPKLNSMIRASLVKSVASELRRKQPTMSLADAQSRARSLVNDANRQGQLGAFANDFRPMPRYSPTIGLDIGMKAAILGATIVIPIELLSQIMAEGQLDMAHLVRMGALGAASGFAGGWSGAQVQYLLSTPTGQQFLQRTLAPMGIAGNGIRGVAPSVAGAFVGGAAASAVFSYGAYLMGVGDLQAANRNMVAGLVGAGTGLAASSATMALIAAYGTAGTGTAISGLSGVAATNAALAWLGGGTVAAGGLGTAGGTVALATGVGVVIVATTGFTLYVYHVLDEIENRERVDELVRSVAAASG